MTNDTSNVVENENVQNPVARIDAEDETFIRPIREFLETYGCAVFLNQKPENPVLYHIVCASRETVKAIFLQEPRGNEKRLAILVGEPPMDEDWGRRLDTKIISIDAVELTKNNVRQIFSFFFTAKEITEDRRTTREPSVDQPNSFDRERVTEEEQPPQEQLQPPEEINIREVVNPKEDAGTLAENDRRRIEETIANVFRPQEEEHRKVLRRRRKRPGMLWIVMFLALTAFPFAWYGTTAGASVLMLELGEKLLLAGKAKQAQQASTAALSCVAQSRAVLDLVGLPLGWVGRQRSIRGQERMLSLFEDVARSEHEIAEAFDTGQEFAAALMLPTSERVSETPTAVAIGKLRNHVDSIQNSLGLAKANLESLLRDGTFPLRFAPVRKQAETVHDRLTVLHENVVYVEQLLTLYPLMAGFSQKQTYLVLLQNSMELRPTGGFIGSIATVTLAEGRVEDLQIQDVYAVDGQLAGHVDPPQPVRELLGQEHWYLRDSNWDPDFSASAARAAWFYEKETGTRVDGVFAVTTPFIVELLKATGPLELTDYSDRVSAENFFGKSLFYAQSSFFPGSTQKKDFLGSLTNALIAKLTLGKGVKPTLVFAAFEQALRAHDVMFFFVHPDLQALLVRYGWAGRVEISDECGVPTEVPCLSDRLAVVEANMSVSKANYFVKRSQIREVIVSEDGSVRETVTLAYRNTASEDGEYGVGSYRAYVRFYLPKDSTRFQVKLDEREVPQRDPHTKAVTLLPYAEQEETNPSAPVPGVAFDVAPGVERRLTFSYERTKTLDMSRNSTVYELTSRKQPGTTDDSSKLIVTYPLRWESELLAWDANGVPADQNRTESSLAKSGRLEYNTSLSHDTVVRLQFSK